MPRILLHLENMPAVDSVGEPDCLLYEKVWFIVIGESYDESNLLRALTTCITFITLDVKIRSNLLMRLLSNNDNLILQDTKGDRIYTDFTLCDNCRRIGSVNPDTNHCTGPEEN